MLNNYATPVIAIIGRPNVGKSTLFNRITRSKHALVLDLPGVTRDRNYGSCKLGELEQSYIVIDTGGITDEDDLFDPLISLQSWQAVSEADLVLFMVDATAGVTSDDNIIAQKLRKLQKPLLLVVNKTDGFEPTIAISDFYALAIANPIAIAANSNRGVSKLIEQIVAQTPVKPADFLTVTTTENIKFAIVGKPNVGKSTLTNAMLSEERVVVLDQAGTTRDSIYIPCERRGKNYTIIDTAGVRKKGKVSETVEKFSIVKTLQAIRNANVIVLLIDAAEGIGKQDLDLISFIEDSGSSLIIAINKWDSIDSTAKDEVKKQLTFRLRFLHYVTTYYISALHNRGIADLFNSIDAAYLSAMQTYSTNKLTTLLETAVRKCEPPLANGRRIKLRYAHQGDSNPDRKSVV